MLNSFGKVVGSIDGLRHRLDSLTVDEIDSAQEKLKTLSLRLSELQQTLEWLSTIKDRSIQAASAKAKIVAETVDFDALERTPTPLQLSTIGQLRNLIIFPRANRAATEAQDKKPQESQTAGSPLANSAQALVNPVSGNNANHTPPPHSSNDLPEEPETLESSARGESDEAIDHEVSGWEPEKAPSSAADLEGEVPTGAPLWTLQHDDAAAVTRSTLAPETETTLKMPSDAEAPVMEWREKSASAAVVSTDSQIASGFEFDQRLLNDLIKDYGEFVIPSPASTATVAEPTPLARYVPPSDPQIEAEFPVVDNVTVRETLPTPRQDGELDRKLKKLIKDYGEYDLYSDQTAKKYRAGVVAAFVILGVVLGGVYFFFPSQKDVSTKPSSAIQSETGSESSVEDAKKSDAGIGSGSKAVSGQGDALEPIDPSGSRGSGTRPRANKNNKNQKQ